MAIDDYVTEDHCEWCGDWESECTCCDTDEVDQ